VRIDFSSIVAVVDENMVSPFKEIRGAAQPWNRAAQPESA
jgi:hypothetical protein